MGSNVSATYELYEAIRDDDCALAQKAISEGADLVSELGIVTFTPLAWSTYLGSAEMVELLINAGAPVPVEALEIMGDEEMTDWRVDPITEPRYARIIELLVFHGASPCVNTLQGEPLIESFPEKYYPIIHKVLSEALGHWNK